MGKNGIMLLLLAAVLLSGCGNGAGNGAATDAGINAEINTEINIGADALQNTPDAITEQSAEAEQETEQNVLLYGRSPVSYDLESLPAMENGLYALWEGRVYFRQYTDKSLAEGGLWADFEPLEGVEKALMCMEPDGGITQTGVDSGDGPLFVVNGRMYSQRCENDTYRVYSCGLDGKEVEEYASSRVLAEKNGRIICRTAEGGLSLIDTNTDANTNTDTNADIDAGTDTVAGRERVLVEDKAYYLDATEEEVFFYGYQMSEETEREELVLCAVDYEGTVTVLKMITRQEYLDCMGEDAMYEYPMDIPCFRCMGDTLYFSTGSYNGNAHMYSGGPVYSMKKDGSGCRVEAVSGWEYFYVYDVGEDRVLYYVDSEAIRTSPEDTGIRPVSLRGQNIPDITLPPPYAAYDKPYLHGESNAILWYPDTSGICYVLLSGEESAGLSIDAYVDGSRMQKISEFDLVDGKLFFTVTDLSYNRESSIGWRDYYDRGRSVCYCKELRSGEIRLLYEY